MSKKGLIHGGESTSHDSGNDILYTVEETGQQVLIEGDEYHLCKASLMNNDIHEYKNKTNKEILDDIYTRSSCMVKEGEANVGDFIICKLAVRDKTKRNLTGTIAEIVSIMQKEHGCRVVDGAEYEKMKKGGKVSAVLLAPNGKPSKLNETQWHLVRTPEFKEWFGDWENDPANASKVVDENGEPLMVYHGTKEKFYVFDLSHFGKTDMGFFGKGFYFTPSKEAAKTYASISEWDKINDTYNENGIILSCFMNLKTPIIVKSKSDFANASGKKEIREGYDGKIVIPNSLHSPNTEYIAFEPNQIKLADGTNTTFDANNPDIRFKKGGYVRLSKTPAPKKERIYGSERNPKGTSESGKSAESIEFSESTLNAIKNKVEEHNKKHPEKKITLDIAKAVVRRGMGAYSSTHRPTIKGGKPNSRVAWGIARLNAFIYKVVNGKSKSGRYSEDNDLLDELDIKHQKFADGGSILLAPNGKPSNLNETQWHLVRTPEFKAWFGDWENDPENSGKISGITKEPTIWYHSTKSDFISKKGENIFKNPPFFFAIRKDISEDIVRIQQQKIKGRVTTKPFFVKYKNPFDITKFNILSDKKLTSIIKKNTLYNSDKEIASFQIRLGLPSIEKNTWFLTENKEVQDWIKSKNFDSFFVYEDGAKNLAVFNPEQIKLADGSNTTFDANNPDIRYEEGGSIESESVEGEYDSLYKFLFWNKEYIPILAEKYGIKESDWEDNVYGELGYDEEILKEILGKEYRIFYNEDEDLFEISKKKEKNIGNSKVIQVSKQNEDKVLEIINKEIYSEFKPRLAILWNDKIVGGSTYEVKNGVYKFDLAILPDYQGFGLSKVLVNAIIDDAKKIKAKSLQAQVVNNYLYSLLDKMGFSNYKSGDSKYSYLDLKNFADGGGIAEYEIGGIFQGTPYNFNAYSTEYIGTGEGNQVFGWGLYFTDQKDIARYYMSAGLYEDEEKILLDGKALSEYDVEQEVKDQLVGIVNTIFGEDKLIPNIPLIQGYLILEYDEENYPEFKELVEQSTKTWNFIKDKKISFRGNIYSVTLFKGKNPNEYDLLQWEEKPTENQILKIKNQAEKEGVDLSKLPFPLERYRDSNAIYADLSRVISGVSHLNSRDGGKMCSNFLLRAGIDGIKYKAGTLSGFEGQEGYNYVIFDANDITIEGVEKYDEILLAPNGKPSNFADGGSFQPPYPINASGGYDYKGEAKETAQKVDLLTLPKNVSGTHCGNCFFFQQGICSHKGIMLPVTDRMCCSVWDNSNSERSYEKNIENDKAQPKNDIQTFPKNKDGGYTYSGEALKIAEKFDLITLPKNIEGTNCANCSWYTPYKDGGFCFRSNIQLPVNARMSCAFWNSLSVKRDWGFFEQGGEIPNKNKIYREWQTLVNMTALELQQFYNSQEGKDAGLKPTDARYLGIDYGRKSARWILKMKKTPKNKWTDEMWNWANKQISFIKRMSGNKGKLFDDKGNKTRKHTSLLIWGHNPLKQQKRMEIGGIIEVSKRHRVPISIMLKEYIKGVEYENKHSTATAAMQIAKINLMQNPNYYNVISQMKNGGEFKEDSFLIIAKHIFKEQIDDIYGFLNLPNDRFLIDDDLFYFSIIYVKDKYGIVYSADYFVFNDDTHQQVATGSFDFKTRKFNLFQLKKFLTEKDKTLIVDIDIAYDINIFDYFLMKLDHNTFIHRLFSDKYEFSRFGRALQYRMPKKTLLDLYPNFNGNIEVFSIIQKKVKIGDYIFLDLALANEFREKNEMLNYSINKIYVDSENVIALDENLFVYSPKVFREYVGNLK